MIAGIIVSATVAGLLILVARVEFRAGLQRGYQMGLVDGIKLVKEAHGIGLRRTDREDRRSS